MDNKTTKNIHFKKRRNEKVSATCFDRKPRQRKMMNNSLLFPLYTTVLHYSWKFTCKTSFQTFIFYIDMLLIPWCLHCKCKNTNIVFLLWVQDESLKRKDCSDYAVDSSFYLLIICLVPIFLDILSDLSCFPFIPIKHGFLPRLDLQFLGVVCINGKYFGQVFLFLIHNISFFPFL